MILDLENEMYQLSHILNDQKNLIEQIKEESLLDEQKNIIVERVEEEEPVNEHEQNKKALNIIKDAMSGYNKSLDDKVFIHEGSLLELDSNDYRPICRSHLFLFNDLLIISKVKHDKKLEFLCEYDTKKLAVVNIKELTGVKNAINIITNNGSRIYQTINATARSEWIEKFEISMRSSSSGIKVKPKKGPAPQPPKAVLQNQKASIDSVCSDANSPTQASVNLSENLPPEWIYFSPEEIQSEIAQRHFEGSYLLIQKCEDYIKQNPGFTGASEIDEKIKALKTVLSTVILHELSFGKNRDLQSVLKSSRRILKLLVDMDKCREAAAIFLKSSTVALRSSQRQARQNNLPVSELFFCDLAQVASEFLRAFRNYEACTSALIVWSNDELNYFTQQLIKHFLTKGTNMEVIANIVESVRVPCSRLTEIGLDLSYYMEGLLRAPLEILMEESKQRLIETVNRTEDNWQPYNLVSRNSIRTLLKEFLALGIKLDDYVTGEIYLTLSQSTVQFSRLFLKVTESHAIIARNAVLKPTCDRILRDLFLAHYNLKPLATQQNVDVSFSSISHKEKYLKK